MGSRATPFETRDEFAAHLNSLPDMTWKAGVPDRFRDTPIGHSQSLCGVHESSYTQLLSLAAQGTIGSGPPSAYSDAPVPPSSFDSITQWPQCAQTIGDIRDQSDCGCCWAFGAASAASDRLCIATNGSIEVPLSAQATCFCAEDNGCDGGTLYTPWAFIEQSGLVTGGQYQGSGPFGAGYCSDFTLPHCHHHGPQGADPYPDESSEGCPQVQHSPQCPSSCDSASNRTWATDKYSFKGSVYLYPKDEAQIRTAIMQHGPVEAAFTVYADFEQYVGGIYQHVNGSALGGHAIRLVGWGSENGVDYWKVANSWNPYWGEDGYFRIVRGVNECGIEQQVTANAPTAVWAKME